MKTFSLLASLIALAAIPSSSAHPGEHHEPMSHDEHHHMLKRHLQARGCHSVIERNIAQKRALRGLNKRELKSRATACVVTPELVEGPYYVRNEPIRSDIREGQAGVEVEFDIQILDLATCEPLQNAFVELWSANATGTYSGFAAASSTSGGGTSGGMSGNSTDVMSGGSAPTGSMSAAAMATGSLTDGAMPSGGTGGGSGGGMDSGSGMTDDESFLRGGAFAENGNVTIITNFPGFYSGRTAHTHMHVFQNATQNANGTLASLSGTLRHTGQLFFEDSLGTEVFATDAYTGNTNTRTYNDEDSILSVLTEAGYPSTVQTEMMGTDITDGLIAYVAIVVDTSFSAEIADPYWATTFTYSGAGSSATAAVDDSSATSSVASGSIAAASAASSSATTSTSTSGDVPAASLWKGFFSVLALPFLFV